MPQLVPHKPKDNPLVRTYPESNAKTLDSPTYIGLYYVIYSLHYYMSYSYSTLNVMVLSKYFCMIIHLLFLAWCVSVIYLSSLVFIWGTSTYTSSLIRKWFSALIFTFVVLIVSFIINYIYLYLVSDNLVQDLDNLINETYDLTLLVIIFTCFVSLATIYKIFSRAISNYL